ncbi:uncharacterized protein LOC112466264 [Temnothorax curvispinosus]|uniref:Uncharacterized protein LOC112466264 n=1 Tax=Temnothorax curvispinosus TaxID=300111 RepID=A0A6J1RAV0_9HYME|nr:uncharacterized protein LOC112466264 [Temnothorax curvispinosus]
MNFSDLSRPSSPALSTESDVPSTSRSSRFSPYRRSSTPSDEITMITLSTILNETPKGIMLIEYYKKYEKFDDEQRSLLINTCANFFEKNNIKMSMADSYRLEKEILERFPTQKLECYRTGKRGKLYTKLANLKSSFKTTVGKHILAKKAESSKLSTGSSEKIFVPENDAESCINATQI